jgi:hypothetical protein
MSLLGGTFRTSTNRSGGDVTSRDAKKLEGELDPILQRFAASKDADVGSWAKDRWWPEVRDNHGKIGPNRTYYFVVRIGQVFGAAALPVFATAGTLTTGQFWGWVTVVVSIIVAFLVAFDQVYRPGERWRLAFETYHQLIDASWTYFEAPLHKDGASHDPYVKLVDTLERAVDSQQRQYLRNIAHIDGADGRSGPSGRTPPAK